MNPEQLSIVVEHAIKNRPLSPAKTFHICWFENELKCLPANHSTLPHTVFLHVRASFLDAGFTAAQWRELSGKVFKFIQNWDEGRKDEQPTQNLNF